MALQAARRKRRDHGSTAGSEGRWVGGVTPRNSQVTCSAARLSAYIGVLRLFSALILTGPSPMGTPTSTRGYGGVSLSPRDMARSTQLPLSPALSWMQ